MNYKVLSSTVKKWGIKNTQGTTIEEIRSQIQEDLMTFLEGIDEHLGNKDIYVLNECLQIVVDNFNTFKNKTNGNKSNNSKTRR